MWQCQYLPNHSNRYPDILMLLRNLFLHQITLRQSKGNCLAPTNHNVTSWTSFRERCHSTVRKHHICHRPERRELKIINSDLRKCDFPAPVLFAEFHDSTTRKQEIDFFKKVFRGENRSAMNKSDSSQETAAKTDESKFDETAKLQNEGEKHSAMNESDLSQEKAAKTDESKFDETAKGQNEDNRFKKRKTRGELSKAAPWQSKKLEIHDMTREQRRKLFYKNYTEVADINSWASAHSKIPEGLTKEYKIKPSLNDRVALWRGDITKLEIDSIVNAANERLLGGGGVDGAIHRAAGSLLVEECRTLHGCKTGQAKITGGYKLPANYVIHTVGPIGEKPELLQSCYECCFDLMKTNDIHSIAFPCISTGVYGYPSAKAAHVAMRTTRKWLEENHESVHKVVFCLFLERDVEIYEQLMHLYFPVENRDADKSSENE